MKTTPVKWLFLISAAVVLPLFYCGLNPPDAGNSSQVGNPVASMLYNPDGSPAAKAKVCFYRHGDDPRNNHAVDSTYTDNNGNYIASLDTATYNILATLGTNATFQDSIVVTGGDTTRPPADTLRSLGSISGKIELQGTDDPRTVFILFMGSNTFTRPTDLLGNFTATNMAKGKYSVTLITTLDDYDVMDTSFVITAGLDSVIPQPVVMTYTGIPVPKGLRIEYDTMKQIAMLFWNMPTTGRPVQSYTVYRKRIDSASFVSIKAGVTDTAFSDSTGVQDQTYAYCVAVVDTNNTEGVKSQNITAFISTIVEIIDSATYPGYIMGIAIDNHENIYLTDRNLNKVVLMDSSLHVAKTINHIFNLPHDVVVDSVFNLYVVDKDSIYKIDSTGNFVFNIPRPYGTNGYELARLGLLNNSELWVKIYHWPTATLYKYTLTGNLLDSLVYNNSTWQDGAFAFDSAGNLIISDYNHIRVFDSAGSLIKETNYSGGFFKQTASFDQIEFAADKKLFLVDRANLLFCAFDNSGNVELKWTAGQSDFDISSVYGWSFGPSGSLYATEVNKIRKYRIPM